MDGFKTSLGNKKYTVSKQQKTGQETCSDPKSLVEKGKRLLLS